jgi:hypothetical protein
MTAAVQKLVEEVRALPQEDLDQFLAWLAQYQAEQMDDWDKQIERDSAPGGRLQAVLDRVGKDISAKRTKPLDEVINNS